MESEVRRVAKTVEQRVEELEKKIADLEKQVQNRPIQIKTEFKVDEQIISTVVDIVNYINNAILPVLNFLVELVLTENQSSGEVFQAQPLEPPSVKN